MVDQRKAEKLTNESKKTELLILSLLDNCRNLPQTITTFRLFFFRTRRFFLFKCSMHLSGLRARVHLIFLTFFLLSQRFFIIESFGFLFGISIKVLEVFFLSRLRIRIFLFYKKRFFALIPIAKIATIAIFYVCQSSRPRRKAIVMTWHIIPHVTRHTSSIYDILFSLLGLFSSFCQCHL